MKMMFVGADHEVTGSCHYLEAAGKKILVDYGMEQGKNFYENVGLPVKPEEIDYIFLTHAHIDHSGLLPLIGAQGFRGSVYATYATCDLCEIMLLDSAGIQEFEAEWRNRKGVRKGEPPVSPLYTQEDANRILHQFIPCPYYQEIDVCEGIRIKFVDVGHLLGSAAIEVTAMEDGKETVIVFSGDIGNIDQPLLRDPGRLTKADYLVIESTYGDRSHGPRTDYKTDLAAILQKTFDKGGNVIIPSFAVGRTQEILFFIRQIKQERLVTGHDRFPVYVDSPLAVKSTGIFNEHTKDCMDEESSELIRQGINPITFPNLTFALTTDESKAINMNNEPKVIISASGMCEAGRIKHHLKHNLWKPNSTILFVGYQAVGTLGRSLVEGAKEVTLFGEKIAVSAKVMQLPGVSGHADREGLLAWASGFEVPPKMTFVVHGDPEVVDPFAGLLHEKLGFEATAPYSGTEWDLTNCVCINQTEGIPYVKRDAEGNPVVSKESSKAAGQTESTFGRLEAALNRLAAAVRSCRHITNKEIERFAEQIEALCEKWKQ